MKNLILTFSLLVLFSSCSMQKGAYKRLEEDHLFSFEKWEKQNKEKEKCDSLLSLDKAVNISYAFNKQLLAAKEQKAFAKGKIIESLSHFLPAIEALGSYTYLDSHSQLKTGRQNLLIGSKENVSMTLQASQPIFTGGAIVSGFKASKYASFITDENIATQYQKLYFEVAKAYFDILLSQKMLEVFDLGFKSAKEHYNEVQLKKENGLASEYDLLRSDVEVTNFEGNYIKQNNKVSLFKTKFLKLLGMNQEYEFDLENLLEYNPVKIDEKAAMKTAFLSRPDLKAKNFEVNLQKQMLNMAQSDYFPKINAQVAQRWGTEDANIVTPDKWSKDLNFRLFLKWDLFSFGKTVGKVKQEKATLRQKEFLLKDVKETISLEVEQAFLNLKDADKFVQSQKLDLERAQKALELAKIGYAEGLNKEVEVTDALTAMTQSQSLYYQAIYQYNLALIQLKLVMGILKEN